MTTREDLGIKREVGVDPTTGRALAHRAIVDTRAIDDIFWWLAATDRKPQGWYLSVGVPNVTGNVLLVQGQTLAEVEAQIDQLLYVINSGYPGKLEYTEMTDLYNSIVQWKDDVNNTPADVEPSVDTEPQDYYYEDDYEDNVIEPTEIFPANA
jgi:hypothetical protein